MGKILGKTVTGGDPGSPPAGSIIYLQYDGTDWDAIESYDPVTTADGWVLLDENTVSTSGNDFASLTIPSGYRKIRVVATGKRNTSGFSNMNVRFNSDSGSNYRRVVDRVNGAGTRTMDFNGAGTAYLPGRWGQGFNIFELTFDVDAINSWHPVISQCYASDGAGDVSNEASTGGGGYNSGIDITTMAVTITSGLLSGSVIQAWGAA